jgi:hypothetical protein
MIFNRTRLGNHGFRCTVILCKAHWLALVALHRNDCHVGLTTYVRGKSLSFPKAIYSLRLAVLLLVALVSVIILRAKSWVFRMKLQFLILALFSATTCATSSTNASTSLINQLLSNPTSVGISSLNATQSAQLRELETKGGGDEDCLLAVRYVTSTHPPHVQPAFITPRKRNPKHERNC